MKEEKYLANVTWNEINDSIGIEKYGEMLRETEI